MENSTTTLVPTATAPTPSPAKSPYSEASTTYYLVYAGIYACGSLYLLPSAMAWCRMVRNWRSDRTAVRLFSLLGLGALVRGTSFILVALWMIGVIQARGSTGAAIQLHLSYLQLVTVWQILGMVGSLLLVGVFLLILLTWAEMIEQVEATNVVARLNVHSRVARTVFVRLVIFLYVVQLSAFLIGDVVAVRLKTYVQTVYLVATITLGLCFLTSMLLLPTYGRKMCALLGKVADGAIRRQRNIRRIAVIATLFCAMRTLAEFLSAAAQYQPSSMDDGASDAPSFVYELHPNHIIEANPLFFFTTHGLLSSGNKILQWVVFIEVLEFPVEFALLLLLLWVLPSRTVLPSIRGYQTIPEPRY